MGDGDRSGVRSDAEAPDPIGDDGPRGADAPWRPGFDGWSDDDPVEAAPALIDSGSLLDAPVDADERWSREHDERPIEPWRPEPRPRRTPPPPPVPDGPPVATVDEQPVDAVTGELLLTGIVVAVVVVVALLVAGSLRPVSVEPPEPPVLAGVPSTAETRWSVDVDGVVDEVGIGSGVVVVSLRTPELVAFALDDGAELWRRQVDLPDRGADSIAVMGDRVVIERRSTGGATGVTVLDAASGDEVWTSDDESTYRVSGDPGARFLVRLSRSGDVSQLEVLDPVDGAPLSEPVPLSAVSVAGVDQVAQRFARERVGVWSMDTGALVAGPVSAFSLRTVAVLDGAIVALDLERRIVAFGPDGRRLDERPFESDAFGEFRGRAELAGTVADAGVGVVSSGTSLGFEVRDGRIETLWERPGRAQRPVPTARGPVSLLVGPQGDSGEIDDTLIDPRTGETLVVTDEGTTREAEPILGHEAYVAAPEIGAAERRLEAFTYDGEPLWQLEIDASAGYHVADGVVVVVEREQASSTIAVAG